MVRNQNNLKQKPLKHYFQAYNCYSVLRRLVGLVDQISNIPTQVFQVVKTFYFIFNVVCYYIKLFQMNLKIMKLDIHFLTIIKISTYFNADIKTFTDKIKSSINRNVEQNIQT